MKIVNLVNVFINFLLGLTLSNVDASNDNQIAFTLPELKKMPIKKGLFSFCVIARSLLLLFHISPIKSQSSLLL